MSLHSNSSAEDKDLPNLTQVVHGHFAIVFLRVWLKAKKASGLQLMQNKQHHCEFLAAERNVSGWMGEQPSKAEEPEAKLSDTHSHEKSDLFSLKKASKD